VTAIVDVSEAIIASVPRDSVVNSVRFVSMPVDAVEECSDICDYFSLSD